MSVLGWAWSMEPLPLLILWITGIFMGLLLPRPSGWRGLSMPASFVLSSSGLRNLVVAGQGFFIVRDVWYQMVETGTFRRFCKAVLLWACFQGWHFDFPSSERPGAPMGCSSSADEDWYVTEKDLAFFQYHGEGDGGTQGAGPWELMMEKEIPGTLKYTGWRRVLPNGKSEYKSSTTVPNATAEEACDLYFDDSFRPEWDLMISAYSIAEVGDASQRQAVVRWTRKFPFSFINSRQYTIARRCFRTPDGLYGVTKACNDHPSSVGDEGVVSVDQFYSMWRSRDVECPWGSGRPAAETTLLHHEQLKIPENLARFAVRHGMWGFVRKMGIEAPRFVAARRARGVPPHTADPNAYAMPSGASTFPARRATTSGGSGDQRPPRAGLMKRAMSTPTSALSSRASDGSDGADSLDGFFPSSSGRGSGSRRPARRLRSFAAFALAGSFAMLFGRKGSVADGLDGLDGLGSESGDGGGARVGVRVGNVGRGSSSGVPDSSSASSGSSAMQRTRSVPAHLGGGGRHVGRRATADRYSSGLYAWQIME
ncbi:hypothetical protein FOA52_001862 [Chlamydomonas sp. UWO 241]|nr:hypothetical protein FOA52_001862 [Chlamydomonas sp. UWO 241]